MEGQKIHVIGVMRGKEFSPNLENNDSAIFQSVVKNLQGMGYDLTLYGEKTFIDSPVSADVVVNMARGTSTLSCLKIMEDDGCLVINSAYGIENCIRKKMTELLLSNGIPYPESLIVSTDTESLPVNWTYPCWLKRGDSHAMVKEDVSYVETAHDALSVLKSFRLRNIQSTVINEHLTGDLVKFYGVRETGFFYWYYSSPNCHSKFGLEMINGEAKGIPFDVADLQHYAEEASSILNVPVYGGDCVVTAPGQMKIIDFNDWPSFSRCRDEAGENIAAYINQTIKKRIKK